MREDSESSAVKRDGYAVSAPASGSGDDDDRPTGVENVRHDYVTGQGLPAHVAPWMNPGQGGALSRVPVNENWEPRFEAMDKDTAWDALVESAAGNVDDARAVAQAQVDMHRARVTAAQTRVEQMTAPGIKAPKLEEPRLTGSVTEMLAAKRAAREAYAAAVAEYDRQMEDARREQERARTELAQAQDDLAAWEAIAGVRGENEELKIENVKLGQAPVADRDGRGYVTTEGRMPDRMKPLLEGNKAVEELRDKFLSQRGNGITIFEETEGADGSMKGILIGNKRSSTVYWADQITGENGKSALEDERKFLKEYESKHADNERLAAVTDASGFMEYLKSIGEFNPARGLSGYDIQEWINQAKSALEDEKYSREVFIPLLEALNKPVKKEVTDAQKAITDDVDRTGKSDGASADVVNELVGRSLTESEAEGNAIKKEIQKGRLLHLSERLSPSSERYLTEAPRESEGPGLVPASDLSSGGKGSALLSEKQRVGAESYESEYGQVIANAFEKYADFKNVDAFEDKDASLSACRDMLSGLRASRTNGRSRALGCGGRHRCFPEPCGQSG